MKKHDHKKTKDIKSKLFCTLMLLPFIYIFSYFAILALNENSIPETTTIANQMSQSVTSLTNWAPINWANSSTNPIRQTIVQVTSALRMNDSFIVPLTTYWITTTIIYIIFDIIIEAIVYITHIFNKEQ